MIAKGIKRPFEVGGYEFKMKAGSVMSDSLGWTGADAQQAASWNYHHGFQFAQETLGSKRGDIAEETCEGEGREIDHGM